MEDEDRSVEQEGVRERARAEAEPYARILAGPMGLMAALGLVAWMTLGPRGLEEGKRVVPGEVEGRVKTEPKVVLAPPAPVRVQAVGPPVPVTDFEAVARAEKEREEANRALAAAEEEEERLRGELGALEGRLREESSGRDSDELLVSIPRGRIEQARARLASLAEKKAGLDRVVVQLEGVPPARVALNKDASASKSPVAREVSGEEYHFEIRGDRVTFLDLERLLELAEKDARLRLRMTAPTRPIKATVGPVGAFSLEYELGPSPLGSLVDLLGGGAGGTSFTLLGFEAVPVRRVRGETLEMAVQPTSEFARVVNRLRPGQTTITLWVYPDGFRLYRRLSELLSRSGFFVAARPLPEEIPIRGSPTGSKSAAQ